MKKKIALFLICISSNAVHLFAQGDQPGGDRSEVPLTFNGVNGWMNQKIGNATNVFDCHGLSQSYVNANGSKSHCLLYGKVDEPTTGIIDACSNKITDLYPDVMRYGGSTNDNNMPTRDQWVNEIDRIRSLGAEPIIQIPYGNGKYTVAEAYDLIYFLNTTKNKKIKYVSIGNEPDLYSTYTGTSQQKADFIAAFFRPRADTIKYYDQNIKIISPALAWYDESVMSKLLDSTNAAQLVKKNHANKYRLDIVDMHYYPFSGSSDTYHTRANVILNANKTTSSSPRGFKYILNHLVTEMDKANTTRSSKLQYSVSEINVCYKNRVNNKPSGLDTTAVSTNSLLAGQWLADCYAVILDKANTGELSTSKVAFVTPWSIYESGGDSSLYDLGILKNAQCSANNTRSTYQHMAYMAKYFKGSFYIGSQTNGNTDSLSVFGTYLNSGHYAVMIVNKGNNSYSSYTVNTYTATPGSGLWLQMSMGGTNYQYTYSSGIPGQTTDLILLNCTGSLLQHWRYDKSQSNSHAGWVSKAGSGSPIVLTTSSTNSNCNANDGTASVTATGGTSPYYYLWSTGATTASINSLAAGTYTVTVNGTNCTAGYNAVVTIGKKTPVVTISSPTWANSCSATNATFQTTVTGGTSPYTYSWNPSGSTTASITVNQPASTTMYTVTVTDNKTCANTAIATYYKRSVTITKTGSIGCACPNSVTLTATYVPNADYQWYKGINQVGSNSNVHITTTTGTYSVVVDPINGDMDPCATVTVSTTVSSVDCGCKLAHNPNEHSETFENAQLLDNVPNPSTGMTTFMYLLTDEISKAEIRISDIYGNTIERIPVSKESNNVEFNCSNCANGVYFYTLVADNRKTITKKMVIAR